MNKGLLVFVFCGFVFSFGFSQNLKMGAVSKLELTQDRHPIDSDAVAAIIFQKTNTHFLYTEQNNFTAVHECQVRIKIYKKEGLHWGTFKVPYYVGYEKLHDDSVQFSNAVTYNLENGEIIKTKLSNQGDFKQNINKYWNQATITLPNVKVGSIIEFQYVLKSENLLQLPVFNFQYDIPVNYAEYTTKIPELFVYKPIVKGFIDVQTNSKIVNASQSFDTKNNNTASLDYQQINSTHIAQNVPALTDEVYVDNMDNYKSSIQYELEKTRYPGSPVKDYSKTWEGVAKSLFEEKEFAKELEQQLLFLEDLKKILKKDAVTELSSAQKMSIVFKFVQQKMNWNSHFGFFPDLGVQKAYTEQTGNVADINFILINMLNLAGVATSPVLVSTKDHGMPSFPSRAVFNYVIAAANVEGELILLDASQKYTAPNLLPLNVLNWEGRLIKKEGTSQEIKLVPSKTSFNNCFLNAQLNADGTITGKGRIQKNNYQALTFRSKYAKINVESIGEQMENELQGISINDLSIENLNSDLDQPILQSFNFTTDNHCEIIANKLFVNPLLFFTQIKNPFVLQERKMPICFGFPEQQKFTINIKIPEGYEVASLPKPIKMAIPNNEAQFNLNILNNENSIQIVFSSEMNEAIFMPDMYEVLKSYFQKLIEKQNEKIVLIKRS